MEQLSDHEFIPAGASSVSVLTETRGAASVAVPAEDRAVGHPVAPPATTAPRVRMACSCGHGRDVHRHYRSGSDCASCSCGRFHRSLIARLAGR